MKNDEVVNICVKYDALLTSMMKLCTLLILSVSDGER